MEIARGSEILDKGEVHLFIVATYRNDFCSLTRLYIRYGSIGKLQTYCIHETEAFENNERTFVGDDSIDKGREGQ